MGLFVVFKRFQPAIAEQHFRRALELNSGNTIAPLMHAMTCLAPLGKLQEAEDELEALLPSAPLNAKALQMMAVILYFQRRYQTAIEVGHSALDILPGSAVASLIVTACYERLGQQEEALKYYRKCDALMPFMRPLKWPLVVAATYKGRSKWVRPTLLAHHACRPSNYELESGSWLFPGSNGPSANARSGRFISALIPRSMLSDQIPAVCGYSSVSAV